MVDVSFNNIQYSIAFKSLYASIRFIEATHFECVDGGFHSRVLAVQEFQLRGIFFIPLCFVKPSFFRKHE